MKNSEIMPTNDLQDAAAVVYRFGQFVLDPRRRTLCHGDSPVFLTPKAFDVLTFLVRNPNRLVRKEELLHAVWGDTFVEEGNLTQYISHLRKALGDNSEDSRLIVTIARKGYQFTAKVVAVADTGGKGTAVQTPATESRQTVTPPGVEFPPKGTARKAPRAWLRAAVVAVAAVTLAVIAYRYRLHQPQSEKIMLAVLPFENLTGDPNKEYLADGLTEETISQLGRLNPKQLGVIARTSVMSYKHKGVRLDQIGRDLSVQYVLENSLRQSGDYLRLTAQLIQVKDQTHLWSQDYDYLAKDTLNVEDEVAKAVAREIRVRLTSQQQAELAQSHPVKPEAFDAYLQGYYYYERRTAKDLEMAARYYQRATQIDPGYALAWVGLSRTRYWQANEGLIPVGEGQRLALEAVERALSLNPNLAAAHSQMGRIKRQVDFDFSGADASIQRALALEPGSLEIVTQASTSAAILGRFDEALQLARRAVDLDPLNGNGWETLGEWEFYNGQLDKAAADCKKAVELDPEVSPGHVFSSEIYILEGRPQDALPEIELVRSDVERAFQYLIAYHALGREKELDAALREFIEKFHASSAYQIAEVYAFRNQRNEAFDWLDRAYAQRDGGLIFTKIDPLLKILHNDPRFSALLKKLNLPLS